MCKCICAVRCWCHIQRVTSLIDFAYSTVLLTKPGVCAPRLLNANYLVKRLQLLTPSINILSPLQFTESAGWRAVSLAVARWIPRRRPSSIAAAARPHPSISSSSSNSMLVRHFCSSSPYAWTDSAGLAAVAVSPPYISEISRTDIVNIHTHTHTPIHPTHTHTYTYDASYI